MPNAGSHIIMGVVASIVLILLINQAAGFSLLDSPDPKITAAVYTIIIYAAVAFVYSQLPDIDHQSSKITLLFTGLGVIAALILMLYQMQSYAVSILVGLSAIWGMRLVKILKHRGFCHSYPFAVISALPLLLFHWQVALIGAGACASHITADRIKDKMKRKKRR